MGASLFHKLLDRHFAGGSRHAPGDAMVRVDQVLLGDGAASLALLALESFGVERVRVETAITYVDEVTLADDGRVAEDHAYLLAASRRMGLRYSPPGNGVGPWLHLERFAEPGKSLVGAPEHTAMLGAAAMLAFAVGSFDAAMVLAGEPYALPVPKVWRLRLRGAMPAWVSATDLALELLRRHGVRGRAGFVLEVAGAAGDAASDAGAESGVLSMSVPERAAFAAMVAELGVVTTLFPADASLEAWLLAMGRASSYENLAADEDAVYDLDEELDLSSLEPMIAKPQSPGNVVPVRFAECTAVGHVIVGGPGMAGAHDLGRVTSMVRGASVAPGVSFELNPQTRGQLGALAETGALSSLIEANVRIAEPALLGYAGVGQAPAAGKPSLRTATQNYPGASGTKDDRVFLCSAATAAISALRGVITRPSEAGNDVAFGGARGDVRATGGARAQVFVEPSARVASPTSEPPPSRSRRGSAPPSAKGSPKPPPAIAKGPSIKPLPTLDAMPKGGEMRVMLKLPDDVPMHEIVPAGLRGASLGSNVAALADLAFERIDVTYVKRAKVAKDLGGHVIVAGHNFGYGSHREHAALALRALGLRFVLAKSIGAAFRRALVNAGVVCLTFVDGADYFPIEPGEILVFTDLRSSLGTANDLAVRRKASSTFLTTTDLTPRQVAIALAGGVPNWFQASVAAEPG